jgi:transcriptional regulator with XRE-family HTH domain
MPARPRATVRLRRLAGTLRRLREARELSREDVETETAINTATLYRIETAKVRPQARTLSALLNLYGVEKDERARLLKLLRESKQSGWWQAFSEDLPEQYSAYIEFEDEAEDLWNYQSLFVHGLLQTEDYARALIRGVLPGASHDEVEQRVKVRMKRQAVLERDDPPQLWAICDESALHRLVGGPKTMREQLMHLVVMAELPHVTLQVVPFDHGAHVGMPGSFMVLRFGDAPSVVYVDSMAGDIFLEEEVEVRHYTGLYDHLRAVSLSPDATRQLVTRIAGEYQVRGGTVDD